MQNIFSKINSEIKSFRNDFINIFDGYSFNQFEVLNRINLYRVHQFRDKSLLARKLPRLFLDILSFRAELASKFLNVDTKDFRFISKKSDLLSELKTFLFEQEAKLWFKNKNFPAILNQIAEELPVFGSVVIKKVKRNIEIVDLMRLILDPTVDKIRDSSYIIQVHYLTETQLRNMADVWDSDEIDKLIRFGKKVPKETIEGNKDVSSTSDNNLYYKIYERYGEVPLSFITDKETDSDKIVRSLFVVSDLKEIYHDNKKIGDTGIVLFRSKWNKEYPFLDVHYSKIKGRWLGRGVYEILFDVQERINELANLKRLSMAISSMHIFQKAGPSPLKNILTSIENGDIIRVDDGLISPVANEERNLAAFQSEEQRYDLYADRISFAHDAIRGESLPATTPATNALIMERGASSVYLFKRENLTIFLKNMFLEFILPEIKKDLTAEHIFRFAGDIQKINYLDDKIVEAETEKYVFDYLNNTGFYPEQNKIEEIKSKIKSQLKKYGVVRFLKINNGFYSDLEFDFDVIVDEESMNITALAQNIPAVLNFLSVPDLLTNPVKKRLALKLFELFGLKPVELEKELEQANSQSQNMLQDFSGQQPTNNLVGVLNDVQQ
jgi:hypothetical protein